jgi:hypothetical protein
MNINPAKQHWDPNIIFPVTENFTFSVLNIKITVFWDVAPCDFVQTHQTTAHGPSSIVLFHYQMEYVQNPVSWKNDKHSRHTA